MHPTSSPTAPVKLLLIEDSTRYQIAVANYLLGYAPLEALCVAGSGDEALRLPSELEPDIVLLDVHLPRRSGLQLVEPLLARWPEARIIALSIDDYPAVRRAMLSAGACDFVSKMEAVEKLVPAIERCMRKRGSHN